MTTSTSPNRLLDTVRVLSIRRPWSELILAGHKPIENRTWTTTWRGRLVIHAGQRWDPFGAKIAAILDIPVDRHAPTGYLGVVELIDIHPDRGCCWPWGEPDAHHWHLTHPRRFTEPIPGLGRLGLYRPPADIRPALTTALDTAEKGTCP